MSHEARQVPAWLIFDVGQSMREVLTSVVGIYIATAIGAPASKTIRVDEVVARIESTNVGSMMTADGCYVFFTVRLLIEDPGSLRGHSLKLITQAPDRLIAEPVHSRIRLQLKGEDVIRTGKRDLFVSSKGPVIYEPRPNKAPEPTPGPVTPRAPERDSK